MNAKIYRSAKIFDETWKNIRYITSVTGERMAQAIDRLSREETMRLKGDVDKRIKEDVVEYKTR